MSVQHAGQLFLILEAGMQEAGQSITAPSLLLTLTVDWEPPLFLLLVMPPLRGAVRLLYIPQGAKEMYTQTHTHNVYYYNISQVFEVMGILVQALLLLLMMMVHISSMTNTGNHFIRYFSTFSSSG